MKFRADEIASVIRQQIADYHRQLDVSTVGQVLEVGDGIVQIYGLVEAKAGEMLQFACGQIGQVFDLFHSTKPHGIGLGMAIVHKIITSHGGSIDIESVWGKGTTVTIGLPRGD